MRQSRDAVQYIRMSTDKQDLSPAVQRSAIEQYALKNGLSLIGSYEDEGKSGLSLKQRPAMRRLLDDVLLPNRTFSTILVYDVSRWGRFQDTDASAYYEYHCRLHGVSVVYVKELFIDDGTPLNALLKSMKRAMAAEYSRELKVKTRSGQELAIRRGFQMGSPPCIGFRRFTVPSDGGTGRELAYKERKPMLTDRVRWVAGPADEVDLLRRIFRLYTETTITIKGLVALLTAEAKTDNSGRPFTHRMVSTLLKCEAFAGTFVWGRRDDRTGVVRTRGDEGYTRIEGVLEPLIEQRIWDRAQQKRRLDQNWRRSKEEAIEELREALKESPTFSITDLPGSGCPTEKVYRRLFGSFSEALRLAGRDEAQVRAAYIDKIGRMRHIGARFRSDLIELMNEKGLEFSKLPRSNTFVFQGNIRVAVQIIWRRKGRHGLSWWLNKEFTRKSDYVLVVRMEKNETASDFFLIATKLYVVHAPWFHEPGEGAIRLSNASDLIDALTKLVPSPPYEYLPELHRRLRYITPLPIEVAR